MLYYSSSLYKGFKQWIFNTSFNKILGLDIRYYNIYKRIKRFIIRYTSAIRSLNSIGVSEWIAMTVNQNEMVYWY